MSTSAKQAVEGERPTIRKLLQGGEATVHHLARRWGPAALLFLPAAELVDRELLNSRVPLATVATPSMRLIERTLSLLRAFPDMELCFLSGAQADEFVIGRAPDVSLFVPDASLSRSHAVVRWEGESYWLRDQGSLNGSYINSQRVGAECPLQDGDTIALGDTQFVFVTSNTLALQLESLRKVNHAE